VKPVDGESKSTSPYHGAERESFCVAIEKVGYAMCHHSKDAQRQTGPLWRISGQTWLFVKISPKFADTIQSGRVEYE
jgi:hypothetical protein